MKKKFGILYLCMGGKCDHLYFSVRKQLKPEDLIIVNNDNGECDEYFISEDWSLGFCLIYCLSDLEFKSYE